MKPRGGTRRLFRLAGRFGLLLFAFVLGAAVTAAAGVLAATQKGDAPYEKLEIFAKVFAHIRNSYVDDVDETRLVYGAIRGMLSTLDPHTAFLDPAEYQAAQGDTDGRFGGLGFEFAQKDDALVVIGPIDDTPAARAGLRAGDVITAIDGISTRALSVAEATQRLRGPPGTPVTLSLARPEFAQPRPFTLIREQIRIVSVEGRVIDDAVGYVKIKNFQNRTDSDLKAKLLEIRRMAGPRFKGLVLDLRNNPGGLLDEAVKVADRFLPKGDIVATRGRGGRHQQDSQAVAPGTEPDYPVAVLINRGTASASEVVAGALQDHERDKNAVVLGTTSFGKGSVQTLIGLDDGSALKLTVARYYTPNGRSIQESGIVPDVLVEQPGDQYERTPVERDLRGHFANDVPPSDALAPIPGEKLIPARRGGEPLGDPQLAAAVEAVEHWTPFRQALATAREASRKPAASAQTHP